MWKEAKDLRNPGMSFGGNTLGFRNPVIPSDVSQRADSDKEPCTKVEVSSDSGPRSNRY